MQKNKFKHVILFPHKLGQTKQGVDKTPAKMKSFINRTNHRIINVKLTGNLFKNIQNLYNANKKCGKSPIVNDKSQKNTLSLFRDFLS